MGVTIVTCLMHKLQHIQWTLSVNRQAQVSGYQQHTFLDAHCEVVVRQGETILTNYCFELGKMWCVIISQLSISEKLQIGDLLTAFASKLDHSRNLLPSTYDLHDSRFQCADCMSAKALLFLWHKLSISSFAMILCSSVQVSYLNILRISPFTTERSWRSASCLSPP